MIIYDIECFRNFFSITLKKHNDFFKYILFENKEIGITKSELINLIKGETLVGFNNKNYDDTVLDYFIENDHITNVDLKILNDHIIGGDKIHLVRKKYLKDESIYNSIDVFYRNPISGSLKVYEHYKRLNNISESPIEFEDDVKSTDIDSIMKYNMDDVNATEMLYYEVKPLLDSLDDLRVEYNVYHDLKSITSGQIVDRFFESTIKPPMLSDRMIVDLNQQYDFTISDPIVSEHLNKIRKYGIKTYDSHTIKSELIKKNNIINDDILNMCDTDYSATILNADIKFGIGGLHSTVEPLDLKSDDEYVIIDCDVNGMYPTVICKQKIVPFYFDEDTKKEFIRIYNELIQKRITYKQNGSPLEESYKLILNTLTGKFREPYSKLFDPSCHVKTCIYGQYFLFSVLENIKNYIKLICQVNTDGFSIYVKRENVKYIKDYLDKTEGIQWKIKEFKRFISKDCNNYISLTKDDEVKTKGQTFNLGTFSIPHIIKKALIDNLLFEKSIDDCVNNCNDMYDFLFFAKPPKKNLTYGDEPLKNSIIRFCKAIDGYTIKSNGKQIANGTNALIQNEINNDDLIKVDRQFYINEIKRWVFTVKGSEHNEVVDKFKKFGINLCGKTPLPQKDGIIKYKGNANYGTQLYNYETVGINMLDYSELIVFDFDYIDDKHKHLVDICLKSDTIFSQSSLNTTSYRFFFWNNTDIEGHYAWLNDQGETSFESWNKYAQKISISGVKEKDLNGNILEEYKVYGENIVDIPIDLVDWIKSNPPHKTKGITKAKVTKIKDVEFDHSDNMYNLYQLMKNNRTKLDMLSSKRVIRYVKPPEWFDFTGSWTKSSLTILQNTNLEKFDIIIKSFKPTFDEECCKKLKDELKPFLDIINSNDIEEMGINIQVEKNESESEEVNNFLDALSEKEDIEIDDEDILKNSPLIPNDAYDKLPKIIRGMCSKFTGRERDMFFFALVSICGSHLNTYMNYNRGKIYPQLYTSIIAPPANYKGVVKYARKLLYKYDDVKHLEYLQYLEAFKLQNSKLPKKEQTKPLTEKPYQIAANSSSAAFLASLSENNGFGYIFETEADSLVEAFKKDWGNYDDILRKAYSNDKLSSNRLETNIVINNPKLGILLTSTPAQIMSLIKSAENGLFSRFIYYIFESQIGWVNLFDDDGDDFDMYFEEEMGVIIKEMLLFYNNNETKILLTNDQKTICNNFFEKHLNRMTLKNDDGIIASINRMAHTFLKIYQILTAFDNFENNDLFTDNVIYGSDSIFDSTLQIVETIFDHIEIMFTNLQRKDDVVIKKNPKETLIKFIRSQKGVFGRQLIINKAENLKLGVKTVDRLFKLMKDRNEIEKIDKYTYKIKI